MIYDVIVVGSGPGGASAAATLAQHGKSVLLVDRQAFPRDKVCGDGLPRDVAKTLYQQFGLDIHKAGLIHQQVSGILISAPSGRDLVVEESPGKYYSMVSPRFHFDNMLHQFALKQGAKFEVMDVDSPLFADNGHGRKVVGIVERKNKTLVEHEARVVIAADGVSSPVVRALRGRVAEPHEMAVAIRAYATLKKPLSDFLVHFKYLMHLVPGYGWIFPVSSNRVNVGLGLFDQDKYKQIGKSLKILLEEFLATVCNTMPMEIEPETLKSWPIPVWTTNESRVINGVYLVGDAGRFVDALTGGGILPAIVTGHLAAQSAIRLLDGASEAESTAMYDTAWQSGIGKSLHKFLLVQRYIASRPFVFSSLFNLGTAIPPIRGTLLKGLAGQHT